MSLHLLFELAAKSLLIAAGALVLLAIFRQRSATERSWIAHAMLLVLMALPLGAAILPRWRLLPAETASAGLFGPSAPATAQVAGLDLGTWIQGLYVLGAGALLAGTMLAIVRLHALRRRSEVVVDAGWLTALARAQQRMGVKYGAALLVSERINSPVSWGVLRPTLLLDANVISRHDHAEAIITHELAHVERLDWAKLLLSRVVTAIFWFNPLVWVLARQCHQLREEAADDMVLRADVPSADYASVLIEAARHECRSRLLAAHGVAPARDSLRQRVMRVLDGTFPRGTMSPASAIGGMLALLLVTAPLAAATLQREMLQSTPLSTTNRPVAASVNRAPSGNGERNLHSRQETNDRVAAKPSTTTITGSRSASSPREASRTFRSAQGASPLSYQGNAATVRADGVSELRSGELVLRSPPVQSHRGRADRDTGAPPRADTIQRE